MQLNIRMVELLNFSLNILFFPGGDSAVLPKEFAEET